MAHIYLLFYGLYCQLSIARTDKYRNSQKSGTTLVETYRKYSGILRTTSVIKKQMKKNNGRNIRSRRDSNQGLPDEKPIT